MNLFLFLMYLKMMISNRIFKERMLETHNIPKILQWLDAKYDLKVTHKNNNLRNYQQSIKFCMIYNVLISFY